MNSSKWILALAACACLLACDLLTFTPVRDAPNDPAAPVADPVFAPAGGTVSLGQTVQISCATSGATIYYAIDGSSAVTESDTPYAGAFTLSTAGSVTVRARAFKSGRTASDTVTVSYTVDAETVATPQFSPASGAVPSGQAITISCATEGATIRYTMDGAEPTESAALYSDAAKPTITAAVTLKAKAYKSGMTASGTATTSYTLTTVPTVITPAFLPSGGPVPSGTTVRISCETLGASIRYTTDGTTEPTESSTLYNDAARPTITENTTLMARAFKSGMDASGVATAAFTVAVATPAFDPAGGAVTSGTTIRMTTATSGAEIRYSTDGSEPTGTSSLYDDGNRPAVTAAVTLKARAYKANMEPSTIATAAYTIAAAPAIRVKRLSTGTDVPYGGTSSLDAVTVSQSGTAAWYEIWNDGNANLLLGGTPLVGTSGTNAAEFSLTQPSSSTVLPGQSVSFSVTFVPAVPAGIHTATITIESNDPTHAAFAFTVSAEALDWHGISSITTVDEANCVLLDMAVSGDCAYALYYNSSMNTMLARSVDGGATWPTAKRVMINSISLPDPRIAISGTGETASVFIAYAASSQLYVVRSLDGGATFGTPVVAAPKPNADGSSSAGAVKSIAVSGSGASTHVYVSYLEVSHFTVPLDYYEYRARLARSADRGATFSQYTVDDTASVSGHPSVGWSTSVWVGTGTTPPVYVTYQRKDIGTAGRYDAMFAKDTTYDGATTTWTRTVMEFNTTYEVGKNTTGRGLSAGGSYVYAVHKSADASGNPVARCMYSMDSGAAWSSSQIQAIDEYKLSVVYAPGYYVYVGIRGALAPLLGRSTDGSSWTFRVPETPTYGWDAPILAASAARVHEAYLLSDGSGKMYLRFAKSLTSGTTW